MQSACSLFIMCFPHVIVKRESRILCKFLPTGTPEVMPGVFSDKVITGQIHLQHYSVYNHDMNENKTLTFSSSMNHLVEVKLDEITDRTFSQ